MGLQVSEVAQLVPNKGDAEVAAEIRADLKPLLEQVAVVMARARKAGFNTGWSIGWDAYGRPIVNAIDITKPL